MSVLLMLLLLPATVPVARGGGSGPGLLLDISDAISSPTQSFEAFDTVQMTVFDFNGDGVKEIVAKNDNNWIYVFDPRSGRVLAEMRERVPSNWSFREIGGVAIGDVDGDGRWDLVSGSSYGHLTVWELDPEKSDAESFHFDRVWSKKVDPELIDPEYRAKNAWTANESTGFDGAPYLADVDGDGADEIFIEADNIAGMWAFRGDGTLLWGRLWDDGNANPWVADLDRDGKLEVVFATDAGRIWVFDTFTGAYKWKFQSQDHGARPGSISLAPGLIDITGDGKLEVVFGTRQAIEDKADPDWRLKMHTNIFALDSKGNVLFQRSFDWGEPHVYMFPAAYDVDGDGVDDVVMMDWNTAGHKPGNWESTGSPNLFAFNGKGEVLFQEKIPTFWSNKNIAIADFDGDGEQEILANRGGAKDGIGFHDMKGKLEWRLELPWRATRGPMVADLYGDGSMQLIVPVDEDRSGPNYRKLDVGYRSGRILVFDLGVPFDAAWDNVFLFNHGLDHLYGGAGGATRPVENVRVELLDEDALAVRIESERKVVRVNATPSEGGASISLTRDGDTWRGNVNGSRIRLVIHLEGGAFLTRFVDHERPEPVPIPPPGGTRPTPPPSGGSPPNTESRALPAVGLWGGLAVVGLVAAFARRR